MHSETDVRVLYQDEWLVAVDKPSGVSVHRGWDGSRDVAMFRVRDAIGRHVWPVHRLDRAASGVLLFATDRDSARMAFTMFAQHQMQKTYLALVRGEIDEDGRIDHALRRALGGTPQEAVTCFRRVCTVAREDLPRSYSLVEACPLSGRLHQIRRHFKHISHPLIGDVRYGKGEHNRLFRERFGLHRLFLHASRLRFVHPRSDVEIDIAAPLPEDLAGVLRALGLQA